MLTRARATRLPPVVSPRWGVVAALSVALLALGSLALAATDAPPRLGVRATGRDGQVVLTWVQPAGLAWDVGLRPGDVVVSIDGRAAAGGARAAAASELTTRGPSGTMTIATTREAGATADQRQGAFLFLALWFALVGGAAFVLAREGRAATTLLVGNAGAAAALLAGLATPYGAGWALATVFVALTAFGAGTFLFFLMFPLDRTRTVGGRVAVGACLAVHAGLLLAYAAVVIAAPAAYRWLRPTWHLALLGDLLGACALAGAAWWAAPAARRAARGALAPAVLGLAAGVLPFCLLTLLPPLLGAPRPVPPDVAALGLALLPAGLALALLSHQFLGITHLVRRGLVAAVVWLGLLGLGTVALDGIQGRLAARQAPLAALLGSTLVTGALFAGAFPPAQRALRRALERRIFPDHYEPAATLRQFGAALVGLPSGDPDALAREILARLAETLDLAWCALALREPGADLHAWTQGEVPTGMAPAEFLLAEEAIGSSALRAGENLALIVPLVADGARVGGLALGPKRHDVELLPEDVVFVAALAPLVATTLQSALRARQLAAQVAELAERERTLGALSARLLRAQEEERRRIALEIHDDPLQRVTLLARLLETAGGAAIPPAARPALEEIGGALRAICIGLRPPVLDDLGLAAALAWLAEDTQARAEEALAVEVRADPAAAPRFLDPALAAALFRVAQEALNNVLKHAQATTVELALTREGRQLCLRVADDGRGYGDHAAATDGRPATRLGLAGMRERLRPWGGTVTIAARPGGGTIVAATVARGGGDDD